MSKEKVEEFLKEFKENATNDYLIVNIVQGTKMKMKGSNLEDTALMFAIMMYRKDWTYEVPKSFKKGEGYLLSGIDKETGKEVDSLIMTKVKSQQPEMREAFKDHVLVN
jgi:hypothetical protein